MKLKQLLEKIYYEQTIELLNANEEHRTLAKGYRAMEEIEKYYNCVVEDMAISSYIDNNDETIIMISIYYKK